MGDKATKSEDQKELISTIEGMLGEHSKRTLGALEEVRNTVSEVDARVKEMEGAGANDAKTRYFEGLRTGNPVVFDGGKPVEEIVDGLRRDACVRYMDIGGMKVPVIENLTDAKRQALLPFRMIRAFMASAQGNGGAVNYERAIHEASRWGDALTAGHLEQQRDLIRALNGTDNGARVEAQRALGTQELGDGAGLIAQTQAASVIEALIPRTAVRASGVTQIPWVDRMPFLDQATTSQFVGEGVGADPSKPREGMLTFAPRTLQVVVALANALLRHSSYAVDALLRDMMVREMAAREDLALMRSEGTEHTPRGLNYWVKQAVAEHESHVFNRTLESGAPTHKTIRKDALKAIRLVEEALKGIDLMSTGWIMTPRTVYGLMGMVSDYGNEFFPELRAGQFLGHPYRKSVQIPTNQVGDAAGVGTGNKTDVYFGSFSSMLLPMRDALEMKVYEGGAYKTPSGIESGISNRETVFTADMSFDFGAGYRGQELSKIESVDWGAVA